MKKFIQLISWAIIMGHNISSSAQQISVVGGLNLSNMVAKDYDQEYSEDLKVNPGFHMGALLSVSLSRPFAIETGLIFNSKGYRTMFEDFYYEDYFKARVNAAMYYLDLPITGKYSIDLGKVQLHGHAGPYIGVGLTGKIKSEILFNGEMERHERKIQWGSEPYFDDLKRLDYGCNLGLGCSFNALQLRINYQLGMANISPIKENGISISHRQWNISIGYNLVK